MPQEYESIMTPEQAEKWGRHCEQCFAELGAGRGAGDGSLDPLDGMLVEGPLVWLARRDGICRGFRHRIEHRTTYFKINGKPYCPSCAEKVKQSIEKLTHSAAITGGNEPKTKLEEK